MTFEQYYRVWRSGRRGENFVGLDDGAVTPGPSSDQQLITRPSKQLKGVIKTLVLLVDFPDHQHDPDHGPGYYDQMLFSEGTFPPGACAISTARLAALTPLPMPVSTCKARSWLVPYAAAALLLRRRQLGHEFELPAQLPGNGARCRTGGTRRRR